VERCPACRARLGEEETCPRCGCDLGLALQAERQAQRLAAAAIHALAAGDAAQATRHARAALSLKDDAWGRALAGFTASFESRGEEGQTRQAPAWPFLARIWSAS